ncbi:MAG: ABC-2 family transporter protein [Timaviella obliquedivisa GSE-PSE-MK23-08B]|jgi:ABC-2 type transport system permease protein|nr:ABC-2 family transporter protein [Timaviella obliquedivisa GSE-PSE-MK23-08B]
MRRTIQNALRKAGTLLTVYYAYMLEYRAELLLWVLSGSLPFILMGVWGQAAQGGQFGLSSLEFIRYFLAAFLARQFTVVWVIWEFEREIVEGKLSFRLLQPIDPGWHHFASHVAERFARLPFAIALIILFFFLYPEAVWIPSLSNFLLCTLVVMLAFVLRFTSQYTFAMFAFWVERANSIESFWFLFYLFLSGLIAPVRIFPPALQAIVMWTPFPYLIDFPASILVGLPVNLVQGLCIMIGWIVLFFGLNRWLWRRGLKRYSGMGA